MMEWFIVVVFLGVTPDGGKDLYVFTDPTFAQKEECLGTVSDPQGIPPLINKLYQDYGEFKGIERVLCVPKQAVENLINETTGVRI